MTIRDIDDALMAQLHVRTARQSGNGSPNLGGVDLALPPREPGRDPIDFGP